MDALLTALRDLIGDAHVLTDRADLAARDEDGRGPIGSARALVRAADADQVAAVMRLAAEHGARLVPQGARTGLVGGGAADDAGAMILLGLDRLNRPPVIDVVNRTATVDAGVRLSTLNAAAAEHGLAFPIDLGADPSIGGMVSANTGGARFLRYGDVRRNVLGVEAVLADVAGTRVTLGGALWKDNAGLDLKQMLVGAGGALGVVTSVTVALQPLPAVAVTAMIALEKPEASEALLGVLEAACGTLLSAFEGISPAAYEAALAHVPHLRRPFADDAAAWYLLVELSAGSLFGDEQLEELLSQALAPWMEDDGPIRDVAIDRGGGLWAIRHAVPAGLRALGAVVGCDIALRRGDVSSFRDTVGAEIAALFPGLMLCDFGHVGDGGLHFNMVWPRERGAPPPGLLARAQAHVFTAAVERYHGSFSAEHGVGPRNIAYYQRWTAPEKRALAGRIQQAFAPIAIGRVDFGHPMKDDADV